MAFLTLKSPFTAEERAQRRRLIISDSLSVAMLAVVTALLAVAANAIYQSYASHQATLALRWRARGEEALKQGKPLAAISALRSALALEPSQRRIEIDLAEALAAAGRIPEAVSYFNTLAESEPGNGMINLQLARLAVRQGNAKQALSFYQRAIYGNWEGNGYVRRREVRLEMVRYLIARGLYPRARNELLVAAGNAPESDTGLLVRIAQLMEQAKDPASALHFYKFALAHRPPSLEAMEGAGRAAFALGSYREARQYLEEAVNSSGPAAAGQTRDLLRDATRLLLLYPSPELPARARALRVLADRQIARRRLDSCVSSFAAQAAASAVNQAPAQSQRGPSLLQHSLKSLASRFARGAKKSVGNSPPSPPPPPPAETLANLQARWKQQPEKITLSSMEGDPGLAESQMQLIYDTERITRQVCGAPTGDDALLLKIAQAPGMAPGMAPGLASGMVEQQ